MISVSIAVFMLHRQTDFAMPASYSTYKIYLEELIMFRMWGKIFKDNRMMRDIVIEIDEDCNRTKKVFQSLNQICLEFDLGIPMWLDSTIDEFKRHAKCRFTQDNFIEQIDFDFLELHVIEED